MSATIGRRSSQGVAAAAIAALVCLLLIGARSVGAAPLQGTSATRTESHTLYSPALDREMQYLVFVPPGYDDDPNRRIPTLYMLHGMGGSNSEWPGYGLLGAADALTLVGELEPFLIVLPQGDQSYWFDHADGSNWGTYVANDVVNDVDRRYRTVQDRSRRAVGGLSMGAVGALQLAMNYPEVFGTVGAHGTPLRTPEQMLEYLGEEMYQRWYGDGGFAAFDPKALFAARPETAVTLNIGLDVGGDDVNWLAASEELHAQLARDGIPHEWNVYPGDHNGDRYWRPHAEKFLQFYQSAFAG